MYREIKHLRKKFFILSGTISFAVIFVMLLILNLLMHISYQNELKSATDMVTQTAFSNAPDTDSEIVYLSSAEKNVNGDSVIYRNPRAIQSVTLNGELSCSDKAAEWFCAGGGIFFELTDSAGNSKYIHKEYKFNRGNTKIIVDFSDNSDFLYDGKPIQADIENVADDRFYVSVVWWASSSTSDSMNSEDVKLNIDSVEIQYRESISAASSENYEVINRDFNGIYPEGIPHTLNNFSCFYLITDKQNNPVELNSGNTLKKISLKKISDFIQNNKESELTIGDTNYEYFSTETDDLKIHTFIYNTQAEKNSRQLLLMSVLSGSVVFIVVLVLIYFVSGKAVKPVSESYRKQKEFISNASHELKTPITVISATTDLMERKNGSDRFTDCIQAQSEKMSRLINEMLTLTRFSEPQKQICDFKRFDISRIAGNSVLYFESRAFEENKKIKSDIEENLYFTGNTDKVDELIGILLDNALKYSDDNTEIKIRLYSEKEHIILTCENSCENFNADDIPHLFDRFYRGDKSHSDEKDGFGLGLSIAKEITVMHNGTISAEYINNKVIFKLKF